MKHKTSNRLADYFLVVSYGDELDPIDTATVTSSENIHIEPDAIPTPTATLNTPTATTTLPTSSSGSTLQAPSTTTRTFPVSTSTTAATLSISPSASPLTNSRQLHHVVSEPLQLSTPPRTITFLSAEALAQAEAAVASAIAESPHPHSHTQQHSHSHPHAAIPRSASHGLHARTPSHGMLQTNPQQTQLGIFSRRASNTIPSSPQHASTDHRRSPSSSASLPSSNPGHRRHTTHHAFLDRVYRARVIDRFPRQDYPEEPFPPGISMFCLPEDIHLSTQPDILPSFHYFCATTGDGHRLYGACLKFWEQVPATIVKKMEQRDRAERKAARQRVLSHALQSAANGGSFADAIMLHTTSTPELSDEESDYEDHSPLEYNSEDEWSEYDGRMGGAIVDEVLGMEQETQHVTSTECMSRSGSANTHRTEESTSLALSPVNQITSDVTSSSPTSSDHSFSVTPLVIPNTNVTTRPASRSHPSSPNKENDPHHLSRPSVSRPASTNQRTYSMNSHIHSTNSHHSHKRDLPAVYAPKCIALLSSHPFLSGFRTFLTQLYRLSLTPLTIPIEHWLTNFLLETPLPPLGECTVQYHVADQIITFARAPPNQPFSIHHFPLRYLFECLELENVITLVECVLCERRILVLSDKLSLLTIVGQTLMTLIFPFQWQHVFIPLLPKALIDFLNAPMPYIIGMHTTWLPADADVLQSDLSDELVIVRLDNNTITCRTSLPPHIPKHQRNKLKKYFQTHFPTIYKGNHGRNEYQQAQFDNMDLAFNYAPSPEQIEDNSEIESKQKDEDASLASSFFFRVYVSILRDYRNYLIYPSTSQQQRTDSLFDTAAFLKSQDSSGHAFLTQFMNTQGFQQFIEDRIMGGDRENESSIDYAVQFFDESICAKRNRSKLTRKKLDTPFLLDRSMDITRTFVAPAPEIVNTQGTHVYPTFPRLDDSLFAPPRYMSPLGKTSRQPGVVEDQQAWENAPSTHEQVVHTVWFICFTAIMSERKIDYTERAFGVFDQMRRTDTTPESDIFGPLMYACGRAGVPDKAVRVLHEMQNWGYPVSATLYALLLQVFSMNGNHEGYQALADLRKRPQSQGILSSWRSARKSATKSKTKPSKSKHGKIVDVTSPPRSTPNSPGLNTSQLPLYQRYQAQFERVFAGLTINTLESCPECNRVLTDADIRVGWSRNCNDYNTKCPCGERFVARFTVRPTPRKNEDQHSPRSKTTIHCEYLSPRVLRKEITNLLHTKSASYLATATFRRTSHTIFWNLMWHFTNYKLPVDHLLPPVTTGTGPSSGATSPRHAANKLSKAHTLSSLPAASTCTSTSSHHPASISMSTSTPGLPSLTSSISSSLPAPLSLSLSLVSPSSSSSVSEVPGAASETNAIAQAATAAVSSAADHLPPHLREVG